MPSPYFVGPDGQGTEATIAAGYHHQVQVTLPLATQIRWGVMLTAGSDIGFRVFFSAARVRQGASTPEHATVEEGIVTETKGEADPSSLGHEIVAERRRDRFAGAFPADPTPPLGFAGGMVAEEISGDGLEAANAESALGGTVTFVFSNAYSWMKGKSLVRRISLVPMDQARQETERADRLGVVDVATPVPGADGAAAGGGAAGAGGEAAGN